MKKISVILLLLAMTVGSLFANDWYVHTKLVSGNGSITTEYNAADGDHHIDTSWYISGQQKDFTVSLWPPGDYVPNYFFAYGLGDYDQCPAGDSGTHHYLYICDPSGAQPRDDDDPMEE